MERVNKDEFFMRQALMEARLARSQEEVPVGCVIVQNDVIIGRGHNLTMQKKSAIFHAEMVAIKEACDYINDFRLEACTMYVTMEPCSMCAGAIINSRIKRLVIGLRDEKRGACGSNTNVVSDRSQFHYVDPEFGLLEEEAKYELQTFFKLLRKRSKDKKKQAKNQLKD
ncbi:MAG: tRNA adenosine(34) deaminase TadA [Peptoniphilaceae bacterium]|nr:tRNA adenosine(34) deaminase TadA [Peptoniphilaceae bacterium]MDY6019501.1 tRNA adenosine(34) deaminase TadA [Anaerococcus sp.]